MGTKKTMLVLCCALVMVFAMSACAFASPGGDRGGSSTDIDTSIFMVGIDYTDVDVTTTTNNSHNGGVILQDSNGNDFIAVDDVTLDLCVLTAYSGNSFSFNESYNNVGNTTIINSNNELTSTTKVTSNFDSYNAYTIDLANVGNSAYTADFDYADNSTEIEIEDSLNGNTFVNYQDQDFVDYDDNDLLDADIFALLNW